MPQGSSIEDHQQQPPAPEAQLPEADQGTPLQNPQEQTRAPEPAAERRKPRVQPRPLSGQPPKPPGGDKGRKP